MPIPADELEGKALLISRLAFAMFIGRIGFARMDEFRQKGPVRSTNE